LQMTTILGGASPAIVCASQSRSGFSVAASGGPTETRAAPPVICSAIRWLK